MALSRCGDDEKHPAHRFEETRRGHTFLNYCPGRHSSADGAWFASPMPRHGKPRRAHFYLAGTAQSICGHGGRGRQRMPYDLATRRTVEPDTRTGAPLLLHACSHCERAVIAGSDEAPAA